MKENKLHSIEISRSLWRLLVWSLIISGGLIWTIFTPTLSMTQETIKWYLPSMIGMMLIVIGFSLAYSRIFKIRGIDNDFRT